MQTFVTMAVRRPRLELRCQDESLLALVSWFRLQRCFFSFFCLFVFFFFFLSNAQAYGDVHKPVQNAMFSHSSVCAHRCAPVMLENMLEELTYNTFGTVPIGLKKITGEEFRDICHVSITPTPDTTAQQLKCQSSEVEKEKSSPNIRT